MCKHTYTFESALATLAEHGLTLEARRVADGVAVEVYAQREDATSGARIHFDSAGYLTGGTVWENTIPSLMGMPDVYSGPEVIRAILTEWTTGEGFFSD